MSRYRVILSENFVTVEQVEQPPITIERIGYNRYKVVLTASGRIFVLGDVSETGTGSVDINAAFELAAELNEMGVGSAEISALFNVSGEVAEGGFGSIRVFSGQELEGLISEAGFGSVNIAAAFELAGNVLESGVGAVEITALFNQSGIASEAGTGSVKVFSGFELSGEANEAGVGSVVVEEDTPPGFDPDYQAVLDFATAQGYTLPSAPVQTAQNTLMVALKSAGIFTKVDRLYIFATDGNADFAGINWANPATTTNALRVNSPTFQTKQGFIGNGVSAYINTQLDNLATASKYVANSGHIAAYRYNLGTQIGNTFGALTSGFAVEAIFTGQTAPANVNRSNIQSIGANAPSGATTDGLGFVAITRSNVSEVTTRKGGTSTLRTSMGRGSVLTTTGSHILARGLGAGGAPQDFSDEGLGVFSLGGDITAQLVDYENAINSYLAAL